MELKLVIFLASVLMFSGLMYMIGSIWFRGKRSTYLNLFFAMGILYSFWALFNGFNVLVSQEVYRHIYPAVMLFACFIPSVLLRYMLHFTESPVADARWIKQALTIAPAVDAVLLLTNPWHREFIAGYEGIRPIGGALFPFHAVISYVPVIISMFLLVRYVIKNIRRTPSLAVIFVGFFFPIVLNVLYTFDVLGMEFDITPFAFIVMFGVFTGYSIQLRLFDVTEAAVVGLFNSLSDSFLVVDRVGVIVDVNPAFRAAFPDASIVADRSRIADLVQYLRSAMEDCDPADTLEQLAQSERTEFHNAEITVSVRGQRRNYSLSKDPIVEMGQYAGSIITLIDISSYRRMIAEISEKNATLTELKNVAESASRAKTAFLANMSHEIRTPMNAIIGMTQIARETGDPDKMEQCLDKITGASKLLLAIINDILDMSKIESAQFELYEERFELPRMVDEVVELHTVRAEEKRQRLTVALAPDLPKVVIADELRLSQVINNLLSNAVKFTPDGGSIDLSARLLSRDDATARIEFSVEDSGIGIAAEQQSGLFTAFEQADLSISKKFGGTGLGLAISKNIVELMDGGIRVDSAVGSGSKFTFDVCVKTVPLDTGADDGAAEERGAHPAAYDFTGRTILLAEDVEINREIVIALLERTGVRIECAEDGKQAVELYRSDPGRFDLIFMDIQMPVMDGYTATQVIRAMDDPLAASVPIIAMTANAFAEDVAQAKSAGMDDHLAKPIDVDELCQKTDKYIRRRSS